MLPLSNVSGAAGAPVFDVFDDNEIIAQIV